MVTVEEDMLDALSGLVKVQFLKANGFAVPEGMEWAFNDVSADIFTNPSGFYADMVAKYRDAAATKNRGRYSSDDSQLLNHLDKACWYYEMGYDYPAQGNVKLELSGLRLVERARWLAMKDKRLAERQKAHTDPTLDRERSMILQDKKELVKKYLEPLKQRPVLYDELGSWSYGSLQRLLELAYTYTERIPCSD